jgi:hypothetical protein
MNIIAWGSVAITYWSTLKYPNYKKDVDPDAHVKVFQAVIRANGENSKEYILNAFIYTYLDWCHNYMSKKIYCIFLANSNIL